MAVSAEPMAVKIVQCTTAPVYSLLYLILPTTGAARVSFQLRRTVVVIRLYRLILPVYRVVVADPTGKQTLQAVVQ